MSVIYFVPIVLFAIAFVSSMLGRGGGTLYVPLLFWFGMNLKTQAIPLGMLLGLTTASIAAMTYGWRKIINWKIAIPFGVAMIAFAPMGAWLSLGLSTKILVLVLALFTAAAVIPLLRGREPRGERFSLRESTKIGVPAGSALGFFAGLIGRGGGSFVVPLLYLAGVGVKAAVAISAFVVACAGASSFSSHMSMHAQPQWGVWILSAGAVLVGSLIGSRLMMGRLKPKHVRWIFICINLGVAAVLIVKDVILG